jgi:hypothetical protein
MKKVEVIIYTRELKKLSKALDAHNVIASVYNLTDGVKIRIVINDDVADTLMDTLQSFANCSFYFFPLESKSDEVFSSKQDWKSSYKKTRWNPSMELALLALLALSTCSLSMLFIGICFLSFSAYIQ